MPYDIMGQEDVLGDELMGEELMGAAELVGAPRLRRRAPRARASLVQKPYTSSRELVLGFDAQSVAAGATTPITKRPQKPFRPERLVVTVSATGVLVVDLKIGADSQLVATGEIPAEVFGPTAVGIRLRADTAIVGIDITLTVRNSSGAAITVGAAIVGMAAE